ncbi:unnamed protein product, partial [Didymodactylos carnosus]
IGVLTVEPVEGHLVDAPINTTLLNQAYDLWKYYDYDTFPGDTNVSSYALFTFDAAWSLILSLQQLCSIQLPCLEFVNVSNCYNRLFLHSEHYYSIMSKMTFLGVSGQIKFSNETADRVDDAYYIVKNIQTLNTDPNNIYYLPVLKWYTGSDKWTYYTNESNDIIWPDLSKNIPKDHRLISGQKLRIAIMEVAPFIMLKNSTNMYNNMTDNYKIVDMTSFHGFFKDILSNLQDRMGFIPVIMLVKPDTKYN